MRNIETDEDGCLHRAVIDYFDENGNFVTSLAFGPYKDKKTAKTQVTRETQPGRVLERYNEYNKYARVNPGWSAEGWTETGKLDWVVDSD